MAKDQLTAGIVNCAIFEDETSFLGTGSVTLPNLANKTVSVTGLGVFGEIEVPLVGHKEPMRLTINWTNRTREALVLSENGVHNIMVRTAEEFVDPVSGEIEIVDHVYRMRCIPISLSGGDVAPAANQNVTSEFSVISYSEWIDAEQVRSFTPGAQIDLGTSHNGGSSYYDMAYEARWALGTL